jgi:hypothetical protein
MTLTRRQFALNGLGWLAAASATSAAAPALAAGATEPVLQVAYGAGLQSRRSFAIADLCAVGRVSIETSTLWTSGVQPFTGVRLQALLAHLDAPGSHVEARALNDYSVTIPLDEASSAGAILAFEIGGKTIPRRGKGPLWIVYPYDSSSSFRSETVYARSIWQLNRLNIFG